MQQRVLGTRRDEGELPLTFSSVGARAASLTVSRSPLAGREPFELFPLAGRASPSHSRALKMRATTSSNSSKMSRSAVLSSSSCSKSSSSMLTRTKAET